MEASFPRGRLHAASASRPSPAADKPDADVRRPAAAGKRPRASSSDAPGRAPAADRLFGSASHADADARDKGRARDASRSRDRVRAVSSGKDGSKPRSGSSGPGKVAREFIGDALKHSDHTFGRADELTAKRVEVGTKVLARVRRVARSHVLVALPHGLTARINARDMNPAIAAALRKRPQDADGAHDASDAETDEEAEDADVHTHTHTHTPTRTGDERGEEETGVAATRRGLSLQDFFTPGQLIVGVVVRVGHDSASSASSAVVREMARAAVGDAPHASQRGVELSMEPRRVQEGISMTQMKPGSIVTGYIRSVEDHGFVVDVGVDGVHAFLPHAGSDGSCGQAGTRLAGRATVGKSITAVVASVNRAASMITLTCTVAALRSTVSGDATHSLATLLPGMQVTASIEKPLTNGVAVKFLSFFHGTVHVDHLASPGSALWSVQSDVKPGAQMKCRVLYVNATDKVVALSAAPHIVAWGGDTADGASTLGQPVFQVEEGTRIEQAVVLRVDPSRGLLLGWPNDGETLPARTKASELAAVLKRCCAWGRTAFVHISRVAEDAVAHLERVFQPGAVVRARVLGSQGIEGLAVAAMKPSVVDAAVLHPGDVRVGAELQAVVVGLPLERTLARVNTREGGDDQRAKVVAAVLRLGENVRAAVTLAHLVDVLPHRALASVKSRNELLKSVGLVLDGKVTARVLSVSRTGRIFVTMKPSLIASELRVFNTVEGLVNAVGSSSEQPVLVHATVSALTRNGLVLQTFGGISGLLPVEELVLAGALGKDAVTSVEREGVIRQEVVVDVLAPLYEVGQVLKVRVVGVSAKTHRARFSLQLEGAAAVAEGAASSVTASALSIGDVVVTVVDRLVAERKVYECRVSSARRWEGESWAPVEVPAGSVVNLAQERVGEATLPAGFRLPEALVIQAPRRGGNACTVSVDPLQCAVASATGARNIMPATGAMLQTGSLFLGTVSSVTTFGAFVRNAYGLTALAPRNKWTSSPADYAVGMLILGHVEALKEEPAASGTEGKLRITLNLRLPSAALCAAKDAFFARWSLDTSPALNRAVACAPLLFRTKLREAAYRAAGGAVKLSIGVVFRVSATPELLRDGRCSAMLADGTAQTGILVGRLPAADKPLRGASAVCVDLSLSQHCPVMLLLHTASNGDGAGKHGRSEVSRILIGTPSRTTLAYVEQAGGWAVAEAPDGNCAFVDLVDPFATAPASAPAAGDSIDVVVTAMSSMPVVHAKKASHLDASAENPLHAFTLFSAAPSLLQFATAAPASSDAAAVMRKRAKLTTVMVDALRPGMSVVAVFRPTGRRTSGRPDAEAADENDGDNDEDELSDGAEGDGGGAEAPAGERRGSHVLHDLRFKLLGVGGEYSAVLSPSECVNFCPYTGAVAEEGHPDVLHRYAALAQAAAGTEVRAKVVAVLRERRHPTRKAAHFTYRVLLSVRPADLSAPEQHLASERVDWLPYLAATDSLNSTRMSSPANVISASAVALHAAGPAAFALPQLAEPEAVALAEGATGWAVVEAHTETGLRVGLGGRVRAHIPWLECSTSADARDEKTGALLLTKQACDSLSGVRVREAFPIGALVPIVLMHVDRERHFMRASIRRAPAATELAATTIDAKRSTMDLARSAASKSTKKRVSAAGATVLTALEAFHIATSAVLQRMAADDADAVQPGARVLCCLVRPSASRHHIDAELPTCSLRHARIAYVHASDRAEWVPFPLRSCSPNTVVQAVVLPDLPPAEAPAAATALSLRPSLLKYAAAHSPEVTSTRAREVAQAEASACQEAGAKVSGYVTAVSGSAVTIEVAAGLSYVVPKRLVSTKTVNMLAYFHLGKLVTGRVMASDAGAPAAGVHMSLLRNDVLPELAASKPRAPTVKSWPSLAVGQVFDATVTRIAEFGVFVSMDGTCRRSTPRKDEDADKQRISGLCHVSEIDDNAPAAALRGHLQDRFSEGDRVRVVIVELDASAFKLSLSMKPSRVQEASNVGVEGVEGAEDAESAERSDDGAASDGAEASNGMRLDDDAVDDADDGEDVATSRTANVPRADGGVSKSAAHRVGGMLAHLHATESEAARAAPAAASTGKRRIVAVDDVVDADDVERSNGVDWAAVASSAASAAKPSRKKAREESEAETEAMERRLASGDAERSPETAEDFERLVASSPNDSHAWIRYMAWLLSITEIQQARDVAQRALRTIQFRLEEEKLNVWTALLNLEVTYGDNKSIAKTFADAQAACDPAQMHLVMLQAYQRAGAARSAECEALFGVTAKKFGRALPNLWIQWAAFRFRMNDAPGARALLQRALIVLPRGEAVNVTLQFALLEYKFAVADAATAPPDTEFGQGTGGGSGSQERGRTLVEGLLSTVPKRLDIWSVYLDQETAVFARRYRAPANVSDATARASDLAAVRRLFDRVVTQRFSSKKMKFLFKKYLAFEREHGDAAGMAHVQSLARKYVESRIEADE